MGSTTLSQLDTTGLRHLLRRLLSLPDGSVRAADQAAPADRHGPFMTVRVVTTVEIGQARRTFDGEREIETVSQTCLSTVSVQAFGTNAYALMQKLRALLESSAGMSGLKALHCTVLSMTPVRNLTGIIGIGIEERANVDLTINHDHIVEIDLRRIDEAPVITYPEQ
ncbi:phage neck terminator protein [Laribacter hongkongensis]|uniref:phage neck terminator protein n=1 Tax=Laribacter hongkongensis TaxID=168471 RepID=UPI00402B8CE3